jgi:hypothetical protein
MWPLPRSRDRERGDDEAARDRAELSEAEDGPDEQREEQVRIAPVAAQEHDGAHADERRGQRQRLHSLGATEPAPGSARADEDQRRDDQVAHRVADPPEQPLGGVGGGGDVARDPEGGDAVRGADRRAGQGAEDDQGEDVAEAVERGINAPRFLGNS